MEKIITGLVLLALGLWGAVAWWWFLVDIIKGVGVIAMYLAGAVLIGLGLKNMSEPGHE